MNISAFRLSLLGGVGIMLSFSLASQSAVTWALDPYAGLHGAFLQPAGTISTPYTWDLNLVSGTSFLANNYVFARQTSGIKLLRALNGEGAATLDDPNQTFELNGQTFRYGYPSGNQKVFARAGGDVLGPSLSFRLGETTRVGFFTRARAIVSTQGVDAELNYTPYFNTPLGVEVAVDPFYAGAAAWGEAGIHLAHAIYLTDDAELRLGGNLRYLLPVEGTSLSNPVAGGLRREPGDSLVVRNLEAVTGFSNGFLEREDNELAAGQGFAADLGVQYAWERLDNNDYRYTIGLSLLDVGQLTFTDAIVYRFSNSGEVLLDGDDYDFSEDGTLEAALDQFEQDINGNAAAARIPESFKMGLPTTISAQFGFRPQENVQLSVAYRGDLPGGKRELSQGQIFTVAAHYSKWWYGGGLTTSLTEWRQLQVGAQVRLGPIFLGSDRLFGSILPRAQLSEGDFFVGLRLHDFGGSGGGKKGRWRGKKGKGSRVRCYDF